MTLAIDARELAHAYNKGRIAALRGISFSLPAGSSCGLIGPDGAGKSSLLGLIAGVKKLQSGTLDVLGGPIDQRQHRGSLYPRIAYMPQGLGQNLYPALSIAENLRFFASLFGLGHAEADSRMHALLRATDLDRFADRPAGKLSGGMKQKLGLCCALIHEPDLLILDEPTTGVDPLSRRRFWELVERVRRERPQLTLLVATAYMEEARHFQHCLMLDHGQLIAAGTTEALLEQSGSADLDSAFTHYQHGAAGRQHAGEVLQIPPLVSHGATPAIEARALTLNYGSFTAVNNVSFAIRQGEIFGFLGSNGCGKTSTMKVLTGLHPATSGEAFLLGHAVDAHDLETRKRVGFMSQSFSLYSELSVRQNLELHARLFDIPRAEGRARSQALIERFELQQLADAQAGSLPLGLRQRLSLAVAVIHEPEVLILDEPTSGVDPAARDEFWRLLIELSRDQGVTIFLSTHFMNEALRCDRISLMHAGQVLACDTPQALQRQFGGATLEESFVRCLEQAQAGEPVNDSQPLSGSGEHHAPARWFSLLRLWALAVREGLELLRDPVRLGFALLGSVFMMIIFGFGISLDVEDLKFAIHDQDQSAQSRSLAETFSASPFFTRYPDLHSPQQLEQAMQTATIGTAIEIPASFGRDLLAGRTPQLAVWIDGGIPFRAETARGYIKGLFQHWLAEQRAASSLPLAGPTLPADLVVRFRYNQSVESRNAIGPGVMALILIFIPSMLTALGVVREKELGSISNFYATPLTRLEFLLGKQLPYLAVSLVSLGLLMLCLQLLFEVPLKGDPVALLLGGLCYLLATTSFGLLISAFTRSQIAAILGTMIITAMPTIQFSGLILPRSALEDGALLMSQYFPAGYFLDIAVGTYTKALNLAELWPQCVSLLGFFLAHTLLSLWLLKKQEV